MDPDMSREMLSSRLGREVRLARLLRDLRAATALSCQEARERLVGTMERYRDARVPDVPRWARDLQHHNPAWREQFAIEAKRIRCALGDILVDIQHVGSSAIAGLPSKPVIDVVVTTVRSPNDRTLVETFESLSYRYNGPSPCAGAAAWYWSPPEPPAIVVVHVCEPDNPWPKRALAFRNYLQGHPEERLLYQQRKEALAVLPDVTFFEYCLGKLVVTEEITTRAIAWQAEQSACEPEP